MAAVCSSVGAKVEYPSVLRTWVFDFRRTKMRTKEPIVRSSRPTSMIAQINDHSWDQYGKADMKASVTKEASMQRISAEQLRIRESLRETGMREIPE